MHDSQGSAPGTVRTIPPTMSTTHRRQGLKTIARIERFEDLLTAVTLFMQEHPPDDSVEKDWKIIIGNDRRPFDQKFQLLVEISKHIPNSQSAARFIKNHLSPMDTYYVSTALTSVMQNIPGLQDRIRFIKRHFPDPDNKLLALAKQSGDRQLHVLEQIDNPLKKLAGYSDTSKRIPDVSTATAFIQQHLIDTNTEKFKSRALANLSTKSLDAPTSLEIIRSIPDPTQRARAWVMFLKRYKPSTSEFESFFKKEQVQGRLDTTSLGIILKQMARYQTDPQRRQMLRAQGLQLDPNRRRTVRRSTATRTSAMLAHIECAQPLMTLLSYLCRDFTADAIEQVFLSRPYTEFVGYLDRTINDAYAGMYAEKMREVMKDDHVLAQRRIQTFQDNPMDFKRQVVKQMIGFEKLTIAADQARRRPSST